MSSNVIPFPAGNRQQLFAAIGTGANVVAFPRRKPAETVLPRDIELRALERALSSLAAARASGVLADVREWLDELEVMEMHSDWFDIRGRCRLALMSA